MSPGGKAAVIADQAYASHLSSFRGAMGAGRTNQLDDGNRRQARLCEPLAARIRSPLSCRSYIEADKPLWWQWIADGSGERPESDSDERRRIEAAIAELSRSIERHEALAESVARTEEQTKQRLDAEGREYTDAARGAKVAVLFEEAEEVGARYMEAWQRFADLHIELLGINSALGAFNSLDPRHTPTLNRDTSQPLSFIRPEKAPESAFMRVPLEVEVVDPRTGLIHKYIVEQHAPRRRSDVYKKPQLPAPLALDLNVTGREPPVTEIDYVRILEVSGKYWQIIGAP